MAKLLQSSPQTNWIELGAPRGPAWTDDFASILPYLDWDTILGDR